MTGQLDLLKWTPSTGEVVSLDRLFDRIVYRPVKCQCGTNEATLRRVPWGDGIRLAVVCTGCNRQGRMVTKAELHELRGQITAAEAGGGRAMSGMRKR